MKGYPPGAWDRYRTLSLYMVCLLMLSLGLLIALPAAGAPITILDSYPTPGASIIDTTPEVMVEFSMAEGRSLERCNVTVDAAPVDNVTFNGTMLTFRIAHPLSAGLHSVSVNFTTDRAEFLYYTIPFSIVNAVIPPVAIVQASDTEAPLGSELVFDAEGSYDPLNRTLEFEWDLTYDGTFSMELEGVTVSHIYDRVGFHTVALRVYNGETYALTTMEVYIYPTALVPPVAVISTNGAVVTGGVIELNGSGPLVLDGSGSHDPDGHRIELRWYVDGRDQGKSVSFEHTFSPGTHIVTLVASDEYDSTSENVTVVVAGTSAGNEPTGGGTPSILAFLIILAILVVVVLAAVGIVIAVRSRDREEDVVDEAREEPREITWKAKRMDRDDDPRIALDRARRREERFSRKISEQNRDLEVELNSPFSGIKKMFFGKNRDEYDTGDRDTHTTAGPGSGLTGQTRKIRMPVASAPARSSFSVGAPKASVVTKHTAPSHASKKIRKGPGEERDKRTGAGIFRHGSDGPGNGSARRTTGRVSATRSGARRSSRSRSTPERDLKKELDRETNKMDSFLGTSFLKRSGKGEDSTGPATRSPRSSASKKQLDSEMKRMESEMEMALNGLLKK